MKFSHRSSFLHSVLNLLPCFRGHINPLLKTALGILGRFTFKAHGVVPKFFALHTVAFQQQFAVNNLPVTPLRKFIHQRPFEAH